MKNKEIADKIIKLKEADLNLRAKLVETGELFQAYNKEMEALHIFNATALHNIIDDIGYPTIDKVGKEASAAAWLIIQHAISLPPFMKKCLRLLEDAVSQEKANKIQLAYLSDRISVLENKPQLYGTQFDWDENGELNPQQCDDVDKVNERRKELNLNNLEEQTALMRQQAKSENESPPKDFDKKKQQYDEWRRNVGWI